MSGHRVAVDRSYCGDRRSALFHVYDGIVASIDTWLG